MDKAHDALVVCQPEKPLHALIMSSPAGQPLRGEAARLGGLQQAETDAGTGVLLFDQRNPVVMLIATDHDDDLRRMAEALLFLAKTRLVDVRVARFCAGRKHLAQSGARRLAEPQEAPWNEVAVIWNTRREAEHVAQLLRSGAGFAKQSGRYGSAGVQIELHRDSKRRSGGRQA